MSSPMIMMMFGFCWAAAGDAAHESATSSRPAAIAIFLMLSSTVWMSFDGSYSVARLGDLFGQLRRSELDRQLVDRAVECERHLVIPFVHRCPGVEPDVEGLVSHLQERDRVWLLLR